MSEENEIVTPLPADTEASQKTTAPASDPEKDSWWDIVKFVLLTAAIVLPIRFFIAQPFLVSGPSMDPTFHNNDYLLVDEISYRFLKPARGEVIVFRRQGESKYLIKRIAGLPNETLTLEGNTVTVKNAEHPDGFVWEQPFVQNHKPEQKLIVKLDAGEYFVLGDNRPVSYDSRGWGALGTDAIVGRPFLRLYPFNALALWPGNASE